MKVSHKPALKINKNSISKIKIVNCFESSVYPYFITFN